MRSLILHCSWISLSLMLLLSGMGCQGTLEEQQMFAIPNLNSAPEQWEPEYAEPVETAEKDEAPLD